MLTQCEEIISTHILEQGRVEGLFEMSLNLGITNSWTRECVQRLESKKVIRVIRNGTGRGHKAVMLPNQRVHHER